MIRILHVFHEMENGGTGHFVMNYYRHIDRNKVQFDFLTSVIEPGYFDAEIKSLGGRLFHAYPFSKNPIKNYLDIARIVRDNHYQIVHRHTGSAFGYFDLHAARHGGADHLILHAHNTDAGKPLVHKAAKLLLGMDCYRLACSDEAGIFLFGREKAFEVIHNAIDVEKFSFRSDIRGNMRKSLGIDGKLVIGHVGRVEAQKNHRRLLMIFAEVHNKFEKSVLVCAGAGSQMEKIKEMTKRLGIENQVIFLGQRNDVENVIQTFDLFLMPSFYEGFPVTLVEAQTAGLPCFASKDAVPEETNITGNVFFIPLSASDKVWADQILNTNIERNINAPELIKEAGYDISVEAEKLMQRYLDMVR